MVGRFGWSLLALAASGLAGCATNIMTVPSPQIAAAPQSGAPASMQPVVLQLVVAPEDSQARTKAELAGVDLAESLAPVAATSLFFETGQASLSPDGKVKLLRIADVLRRYPALKVRIEGNADERGPADYNMELGARRARAAKEFLLSVKVQPDQVLVRSNGAERPLATGHDEESWEVNRRGDVNLVHDVKGSKSVDVSPATDKPTVEKAAEKK